MLELKNRYKTELLSSIMKCGFSKYQFERKDKGKFFNIWLKESEMDFSIIVKSPSRFGYVFKEFADTDVPFASLNEHTFSELQSIFEGWLTNDVREYINDSKMVDPWNELEIIVSNSPNDAFTSEETFTNEEIRSIENKLDEIPTLLKDHNVEPDKIDILIKELRELKEDLLKDKKKKWYRQLPGFAMHIVTYLDRHEEAKIAVINFFKDILQNIHLLR